MTEELYQELYDEGPLIDFLTAITFLSRFDTISLCHLDIHFASEMNQLNFGQELISFLVHIDPNDINTQKCLVLEIAELVSVKRFTATDQADTLSIH